MSVARRAFGRLPTVGLVRATPLPRHKALLFALVCVLWIGAGLFGRDPWKPDETDFVIAVAQQTGALAALPAAAQPSVAPSVYLDLAALTAKGTSFILPLHEGARLINALLLAGGFFFIGLVAGARRGVRTGWMGVFLALGMSGFMVRAHLLNLAVPAFFGVAMLLWGMLRMRQHALVGGMIVGAATGFLLTAAAPSAAVLMAAGLLVLAAADWRRPSMAAGVVVAAVFCAPFVLLLPETADATRGESLLAVLVTANTWPALADLLRLAAWALFPTLPLAAAVLWVRGRALLAEPLMLGCLVMTAVAAVHFLLFGRHEEDLFLLMPPLAVFAARGLHKLPDDYVTILDWFAVIVAGACFVGGMWALWLIVHTGVAEAAVAEWAKQFPLLAAPLMEGWKVALAALITILWAGLAANFGRSNERAVLNWSCSVTVIWCVFNLLWVPIVDSGKSYRGMAVAVAAHSREQCVASSAAVGRMAAQVYYFGVIAGGDSCPYELQKSGEAAPAASRLVWRGGRYGGADYALYRRF